MRLTAILALALLFAARPVFAELVEKTGRYGGLSLTYKVLLPPNYDAAKSYPVVLVFTGGPQQLRGAENTVNTDWRGEAEKRGYIVISPGTPDGSLFFENASSQNSWTRSCATTRCGAASCTWPVTPMAG